MVFQTLYPASKKLLLENVSEVDIFKYFCKDFNKVGEHFASPILVDGKPNKGQKAARVLYTGKRFILHDFRIGQSFSALEFASVMTNLSIRDTIEYLCDLFGLAHSDAFENKPIPRLMSREFMEHSTKQPPVYIDVKYTSWTKESILYWYDCGWLPYMLDLALIKPISNFWVRVSDEYKSGYNSAYLGGLSFSYDFGEYEGIFRRKIYNPLTEIKELKWKNNSTKEIIQGLNTIDCHLDTFYLTSSLKDCGPYWRVKGYPCAGAPNSESTILSPAQVRYIRQISDRQVIYYDNDGPGIKNAKKHANLYGFEWQCNPMGGPKDPSDYTKERGLTEFKKLIL